MRANWRARKSFCFKVDTCKMEMEVGCRHSQQEKGWSRRGKGEGEGEVWTHCT